MRPRIKKPLFHLIRNRNFQFLLSNGSISSSGDMSELLVMGWFIHQLTGSPWQVALLGLSHTVSMFAFTLLAGAIGDRKDRRHIIMASNLVSLAVVASVLVILLIGSVDPYFLFIAAAIRGACRAFDNTSRRALMFHVVGQDNLVQAISLEQLGFSAGRIVGPLVIGVLLLISGSAISVYALLTGLYLFGFVCIFLLKTPPVVTSLARRPFIKSIGEGLKYAYSTPAIAGVLTASVVMNVLFQYHLFIPVIAADHLHVGPGLMGLLAAADGIGFVFGSLLMGLLGSRIRISGRIFLGGCLGVSVFLLAFALSPWFFLSFLILIAMGVFQSGFSTMQSGILLTSSPTSFHSRVFGAQGLAISTGQMGNVEIGALASIFGMSVALTANAIGGFILLLLIVIFMPALRRPIERVEESPDDAPSPTTPSPQEPGVFTKPPSGPSTRFWRRLTPRQRRNLLRQKLDDLGRNRPPKPPRTTTPIPLDRYLHLVGAVREPPVSPITSPRATPRRKTCRRTLGLRFVGCN